MGAKRGDLAHRRESCPHHSDTNGESEQHKSLRALCCAFSQPMPSEISALIGAITFVILPRWSSGSRKTQRP